MKKHDATLPTFRPHFNSFVKEYKSARQEPIDPDQILAGGNYGARAKAAYGRYSGSQPGDDDSHAEH